MAERYHVFISYTRGDRPEWVQTLAENLHQQGFDVFWDAWEIGPGDVLIHELDRGLLESRHGVLVVTKTALDRPYVRAEYAAMMTRAIAGKQRLIPVLLDDVELPPLLASRVWIDFRDADGPDYDCKLAELARALRGEKPRDRPPRTGETAPPPATRYRPEGALRRTLRIGREQVALLAGDEKEGGHEPRPLDHGLEERLHELDRARRRRFASSETPERRGAAESAVAEAGLQAASLAAGAALGRTFLAGAAGEALRKVVRQAESLNSSLELRLEIADPVLRSLPWETLHLPDAGTGPDTLAPEPLALHPRVHLYRGAAGDGPAPALAIPGPLRVLVAIGSPEAQAGGGELLDYERELSRILDAVEPARIAGKAHVQILHRGTVKAIREALKAERYHVLHLSCHAGPGVLVLETDDGEEDRVTAERLWREALPPDRGVPLVVLAGCATALDARKDRSAEADGEGEEGEEVLPGLAAELLDHGVPAVLAMQAPVSDHYATDLGARFYGGLATRAEPASLPALAEARRDAERERRERDPASPDFQLAEWATPALYLRGAPQLLYDPTAPFQEVRQAPEARFTPGVVVRKVGEFVGRRREERLVLRTLRGERHAGALIHGMGGVGKSTLAAEVLTRLLADGRLVVSTYGETAPETILEEVGKELLGVAQASGVPEDHPIRQVAVALRRPDQEWTDRFDLLDRSVLGQLPVVLLLDNFEDNLGPPDGGGDRTVRNRALADLLARWLERAGKSRLLVTSRYPFVLSEKTHRHLDAHHLGPLSWAETRKLIWRLDALNALSAEDQMRAYRDVGGHPRALEYLDALLRGGEARFQDVTIRLETALERKGVPRPGQWIEEKVGGDLDRALAETVTLAAADVLLEDLLKLLDATHLARQLLLGASVYRPPVDEVALAWQVGDEVELAADPEWETIRERVEAQAREVKDRGEEPSRENLGLSAAEWQAYDDGLLRALTPPIRVPDDLPEAQRLLDRLGLLSPVPAGEATLYQVHRWTAAALARGSGSDALREAHRRAARFWRWRVDVLPQSRRADMDQLLEARYHYHAAGELDQAVTTTGWICSQLDTWGAYGRVEQLCREVLTWVPEQSRQAATFVLQLGVLAQKRGSYDEALDWYRKSLPILEELEDRIGIANSYHLLGMVAQDRGSYDEALEWYRKSLAIKEEAGDQVGIAQLHHQLGIVAHLQGSDDEALEWYRKSLAIEEDLGNRSGMATSYHQLGIIAQRRGAYNEALEWYQKSLAIDEELGNRSGLASSYGQLGNLALERRSYDQALEWYRKSLAIEEELGNRAGIATTYHQLGRVAQDRGSNEEALDWYLKSLAIEEELGSRAGMAGSLSQIGVLLTRIGRSEDAVTWNLRSLALRLEIGVREASTDLHWLRRQRQALGEARFVTILREQLNKEGAGNVLRMLDELDRKG